MSAITTRSNSTAATALTALLFMYPLLSEAVPAVSCHCFTDRAYDPGRKFAADEYILASVFNSLLAQHFGLPKGRIVKMKMNGTDGDDLLVALELARATGTDLDGIIGLRRSDGSWEKASETLVSRSGKPGSAFLGPVFAGNREGLPDAIADQVISSFFGTSPAELALLKQRGAGMKERALLAFLGATSGRTADYFAEVFFTKGRSWGEILHDVGIDAETAGDRVATFSRPGTSDKHAR